MVHEIPCIILLPPSLCCNQIILLVMNRAGLTHSRFFIFVFTLPQFSGFLLVRSGVLNVPEVPDSAKMLHHMHSCDRLNEVTGYKCICHQEREVFGLDQ